MLVTHVLSAETLFILTDSGGAMYTPPKLVAATQYCCRRFTATAGYTTVTVYGAELKPMDIPAA
jgi:hypothetical protein